MEVILEQQFREIVEQQLQKRGWSRSELARQMDVQPSYVTDYLNGRNSPGPDVIEKFFRAFGLTPSLVARPSAKNLSAAS